MNPLDALLRYPLFSLPPLELVKDWILRGQTVKVALGTTLFQEGSAGDWGYVLLEGRVRVLRRSSEGKEVMHGSLQPGQLFGEYALVKPYLNTVTCRAASAATVAQFPLSAVRDWLAKSLAGASRLKNWLQLHQLLNYLRGQSYLGFMSETSALAMKPHLLSLEVGAMRTLQAPGLCEDWWFFLEEGEVQIGSSPEAVQHLGPGDSFGAQAILGQHLAPLAVSLTPARCLALPRAYFIRPQQPSGNSAAQSYIADRLEHPAQIRWIGQRETTDCGPASLAMLAHYFDLPASVDDSAVASQLDLADLPL